MTISPIKIIKNDTVEPDYIKLYLVLSLHSNIIGNLINVCFILFIPIRVYSILFKEASAY